jgi:hypothetical protein
MKTIFSILFSICISAGVNAQTKELIIQFNHNYSGEPFTLNEIYTVDDSTFIELSRMEYYLHVNSVTDYANTTTPFNDTYLLVNTDQNQYSLGDYEVSDISNLSFHIGVAPDVNHNDPALLPSTHPLAPQIPSMHWGWAAGYRFIAIEGMVDKNHDDILETVIQYHAVDDSYYQPTSVTGAAVETESSIVFYIDVNYDKMFEDINASNGDVFHGLHDENQALIENIISNDVFTVTENLNLTEDKLNSTIYPNPFVDVINLELLQESSVKLYNIQGELIEAYRLEKGLNRINNEKLDSGLYILSVETKSSHENIVLLKQ